MTDPKIVTDADTVARLAKAAKAIGRILGDDQIVLVEATGGAPMVACVAEYNPGGSIVAVAIEGGDVWHYDPDTDVGTPAPAAVPVHVEGALTALNGEHFFADGSCSCLSSCCNNAQEDCTCRDCTDEGHRYHRG